MALAIVPVITGIVLAAVLKGADMINKAKIERISADGKGLQGRLSALTRLVREGSRLLWRSDL